MKRAGVDPRGGRVTCGGEAEDLDGCDGRDGFLQPSLKKTKWEVCHIISDTEQQHDQLDEISIKRASVKIANPTELFLQLPYKRKSQVKN